MKAALLFGLQDLRLVDAPIPKVGPKSVLIRVDACGICPTDIRKYHTIYSGKLNLPENLGHEFVGTVIEVGEEIKNISQGTRIVGDGFAGYAEFALLDLSIEPPLHIPDPLVIPQDVCDNAATFIEPLACCLHATIDRANLSEGQTVLIVGGGTMGQLLTITAKNIGAKVILSEPYQLRREMALSLGAERVIDPQKDDLVKSVLALNDGKPVDVTILTIGNPKSVQECIDIVKPCGRVVLFGRFPHGAKIEIDSHRIYRDEIQVLGSYWVGGANSCANMNHYRKAMDLLIEGFAPVEKLVSGVFPLSKIHQAFNAAASMDTFKIIVIPDEKDTQ